MSEPEYPGNKPIPFDVYYKWLKEFVNDPETRMWAAKYEQARNRWWRETGSRNGWEEDDKVWEASDKCRAIAVRVLENNGWIKSRKDTDFSELSPGVQEKIRERNRAAIELFSLGLSIRNGGVSDDDWREALRGVKVDIDDKESIKAFMKIRTTIKAVRNGLAVSVELGGDNG